MVNEYMMKLLVYKIDDRRLLKILRPLLIWAIIMFVLLILVCRASETEAFVNFIKENRLPFNTTGCPYPKRK